MTTLCGRMILISLNAICVFGWTGMGLGRVGDEKGKVEQGGTERGRCDNGGRVMGSGSGGKVMMSGSGGKVMISGSGGKVING